MAHGLSFSVTRFFTKSFAQKLQGFAPSRRDADWLCFCARAPKNYRVFDALGEAPNGVLRPVLSIATYIMCAQIYKCSFPEVFG